MISSLYIKFLRYAAIIPTFLKIWLKEQSGAEKNDNYSKVKENVLMQQTFVLHS